MQFTAAQIAMMTGGQVEGDAQASVASFGKIEEARAGQLAFLANPKYEEYLYSTQASIVIIHAALALKQPIAATLIRVQDPYSAFASLMAKYQELQAQQLTGIEHPSFIAETATVGKNVYVGAFAYIGKQASIGEGSKIHPGSFIGERVQIGKQVVIHAGVKIYQDCVIGDHVIVHAGAVIGSDGFGFAPQADGTYQKVPQLGNVVIEDQVEIGANTTIDRATMGSTIIRKGVKLDNLVQIAHNVEIGQNTVIAAQTGISGSTKVGKYVMIGGQAGVVGHITIADKTRINGKSGITKSIKEPNTAVNGNPAYDHTSFLRSQAVSRNLPELERKVKELEKLVAQLQAERLNA
ncbi:MAG: UDP-3-O-(3-hydroxymyristoyl)glucosamine N-acyltransferase [Chitinophagales bacterium]|jgi:UDP-3-O-[3-hydroxymyristoyl] glucosamine N-acyltransferase|nr:UDP-3-O-(3-hydroxymyristoyl)glucosamine N-acyltransferase [Chitinophagales bacterium]